MPPIRLDHIAIALPRIAEAPSVLVAVLGGGPERSQLYGGFRWASWTFTPGWPDPPPPVRILVNVEPTAAEGPLVIELASNRTLARLEAAGDRLGIRLAQRSA